jgi:hypothetical protein
MRMPFLNSVYRQVDFDRNLVFKFFTVFGLFEYALKRAGFMAAGRNGEAQPNWENFANAIHPQFAVKTTPTLVAAKSYMLNRPVMKQVVQNNTAVFIQRQRPQNINDTAWLSILIRGVRNNLFHGGKFPYTPLRDPDLIKYSLVILEAWAQLHPSVEQELRNAQ